MERGNPTPREMEAVGKVIAAYQGVFDTH